MGSTGIARGAVPDHRSEREAASPCVSIVVQPPWPFSSSRPPASAISNPPQPKSRRRAPAAAKSVPTFRHISGGIYHTCGVATDGRAYCWGRNPFGGLGDGTLEDRLRPTPVAGGLSFRQVSVGDGYSCGVTTDDQAYCWGWNFDGILGNNSTDDSPGTGGGRRSRHFEGSRRAGAIPAA